MLLDDISLRIVELLDKLQALGDDRAIALHLIDCGVKGVTSSPRRCALAAYLRSQFPADVGSCITVGCEAVHVVKRDANGMVTDAHFKFIPEAVSQFISAFDNGLHPELLDRSHPANAELYQ